VIDVVLNITPLFYLQTFALMVTTGAKGSTVNQSQVSCALGQQALEGRRVPRMSSGRTMPSFAPYDPNPRADGFIADRFLTGIRPQEYYFHCMAGREGLVDTAVKTSRSGYLQRCLVKHLEELKVCYDHTVRDGEGGVVQFLYGEDGIDPTKAAHLDGSSSTLQYMARNHKSLKQRHVSLPRCTLDIAEADNKQIKLLDQNDSKVLCKGAFVFARKLRLGSQWTRGSLCTGWFAAIITKVHRDGKHFDIKYSKDGTKALKVPIEVEFSYSGGRMTRAMSSTCTIIKPGAPDPILSDISKERGGHRIGSSGACVSEKIAEKVSEAIQKDTKLQTAMKSVGLTASGFKQVVSAKYSSALCAPGEAVGCIAAQSIGEPSTQMTLNTFHLAGAGANVTLGIPRLREIIMTASRDLKTPTMSVPLLSHVGEKEALRLTRNFTRLGLSELIASRGGIAVREALQQSMSGSWERAYHVTLKLHSAERISEAFGLTLEDIASVVTSSFLPTLSRIMKDELKRSNADGISSLEVLGGEGTAFVYDNSSKPKKSKDYDEDDHDAAGDEDGVNASRFGHKKEIASYGDMDDEDKRIIAEQNITEQAADDDQIPQPVTDDEEDSVIGENSNINTVRIDRKNNALILQPLRVDPSNRPLLMVGLVERASAKTLVRSRPKIQAGFINDEDGRGRCLQTAGCNFEEIWKLNQVEHDELKSNDIWAVRCAYGVEAARMSIVDQIRGVFAVYGIEVDMRHLTLIADYMTYNGEFKPMNRIGMNDASSSFLQMSFETTANFMVDAAVNNLSESMMSPSANIVLGRPIRHGTGAFECLVK
jgi:DNA-directed RNA polymerase I subunit RPA1